MGAESVFSLCQGKSTALLDRLDAQGAIGITAREDNTRRQFPQVYRQAAEENIDWLALAMARIAAKFQAALCDADEAFAGMT
jgi:hypothetical protein